MRPTSLSLLDRLRAARPESPDWGRLQGVYLPLIRRWLGRVPGLGDEADDLAREWDRDHDKHVVDRLLSTVEPDFTPTTWRAFRRFGVEGEPAAKVAADLGLTENAVILAKSRVLRRLREEAGELLG